MPMKEWVTTLLPLEISNHQHFSYHPLILQKITFHLNRKSLTKLDAHFQIQSQKSDLFWYSFKVVLTKWNTYYQQQSVFTATQSACNLNNTRTCSFPRQWNYTQNITYQHPKELLWISDRKMRNSWRLQPATQTDFYYLAALQQSAKPAEEKSQQLTLALNSWSLSYRVTQELTTSRTAPKAQAWDVHRISSQTQPQASSRHFPGKLSSRSYVRWGTPHHGAARRCRADLAFCNRKLCWAVQTSCICLAISYNVLVFSLPTSSPTCKGADLLRLSGGQILEVVT